jgi:RNA polymerase sigma-70 factor (ECF subfamily)
LQAEIAACHATAPDAESTPWAAIVPLYDALLVAQPSPVIALNRAIAVGFRDGYDAGLAELDTLDGPPLAGYYLLPAARADFLRRLGRSNEAQRAYETALGLTPPHQPEWRLMQRRLAESTEAHDAVHPLSRAEDDGYPTGPRAERRTGGETRRQS